MTRHVIIGGGPAAINAIETIRQFDAGAAPITLVSDEPAYARMALPYHLANQIPLKQVFTADAAYYQRLKVDCLIGRRAVRIDPNQGVVEVDGGRRLEFDNLLLATGSSPIIPSIPGVGLPGVAPLWTLGHASAVLQSAAAKSQPEVVLIGAGFIGFIVLNALYKRGWLLHVVEREDHVLPRMLDRDAARMVERWLEGRGVGLHLGTSAVEIAEAAGRKRITLANGRALYADLVILAVGVRPNVDLAAAAGIQTDHGILVNERMQTNFPHIFAAGDAAQGPDLLGPPNAVHAIQPTAVDHGRVAGANMAGRDVRYPGSLLMNVLDACGLQCVSYGRWNAPVETTLISNPDRPIYRKLTWFGDRIIGAIFVGPASDVGMLSDVGMVRGIIQTGVELGAWKDFLRQNPFDIRRPYIAAQVAAKLAQTTLLGQPSLPRQYRHLGVPVTPQVTRPVAHQDYFSRPSPGSD